MNKRVVKKNKQNKTKEERKKQIKVIYLYAYIESLKRTRKKNYTDGLYIIYFFL